MKKFLAVLLGILLVFSLTAMAACKEDKDSGESGNMVGGNFTQEATEEEISEVLNTVQSAFESGSIVGEPVDGKWNFGLEMNADLDLTVAAEDTTESIALKSDYQFSYGLVEEGVGAGSRLVKGAGAAALTANGETISFDFYNDESYVYIDMSTVQTGMKLKISIDSLMSGGSYVPVPDDAAEVMAAESSGEVTGTIDVSEFMNMLDQLSIKVYVDTTDGLKVKVSATQESLEKIVALIVAESGGSVSEEMLPSFETDTKIDFYLALTEDGKLEQMGLDMDFGMTLPIADVSSSQVSYINMTADGTVSVKTYAGDVTLPSDLGSYTDVEDMGSAPGGLSAVAA